MDSNSITYKYMLITGKLKIREWEVKINNYITTARNRL